MLGRQAIVDAATAALAVIGLVLLVRFRASEPLLVLCAGVAGLVLSQS